MNILTQFMRSAMAQASPILGGEKVIWNDTEYDAIYHEESVAHDSDFGGFNPEGSGITLFIQTVLFTDGIPELNDYVTVRGVQWEVEKLNHGDVRVELNLIPIDQRN